MHLVQSDTSQFPGGRLLGRRFVNVTRRLTCNLPDGFRLCTTARSHLRLDASLVTYEESRFSGMIREMTANFCLD